MAHWRNLTNLRRGLQRHVGSSTNTSNGVAEGLCEDALVGHAADSDPKLLADVGS